MAELTRRYIVMTMATEAPFDLADPDGAFVLKPWKDPAALLALKAYRDHCYPELGRDLERWIRSIEAGTSVRGDIGRRNEPFAKGRSGNGRVGGERRGARDGASRRVTRKPAAAPRRGGTRPKAKRPR